MERSLNRNVGFVELQWGLRCASKQAPLKSNEASIAVQNSLHCSPKQPPLNLDIVSIADLRDEMIKKGGLGCSKTAFSVAGAGIEPATS